LVGGGSTYGLALGQGTEAFYFGLHGFEGKLPVLDNLFHGWWRGGKSFFFTISMKHCVIVRKHAVLDLDLCFENVWRQGEYESDQCWESLS
jgi:hypothetical protein